MIALWYLPIVITTLYVTFVFFCALMKLRTTRDVGALKGAPVIILAFAYLTLILGLIIDAILNILLSILFVELPHEWLTTDRVRRLKTSGNTWQRACSNWLCKQLDKLDEHHCG